MSPDADRLVPIVPPSQAAALADSDSAILVHGAPFDMPSLLRVAVVRAADGDLVIAAVPYSSAADSLQVVAHALIFGTPVLFIVFAGAIWFAVGSTLRPIDLLRRGAARVTGAGVPADLPVPEARDEVRLAGADAQRHALPAGLRPAAAALARLRHRARAALAHRVDHGPSSRWPSTTPSGQDWASTAPRRARRRPPALPAGRGPAAPRPPRRTGRPRRRRAARANRSTCASWPARWSPATRTPRSR